MDGWMVGSRERETDRQTDRQTGRQAGRQARRQARRQAGRQTDSLYTGKPSKQSSFYTKHLLHTEAFTQGSFCTEAFYRFYTQSSFYTQRLLHRAAFGLCTAFAHQVPRLPRQTTASSPGVPGDNRGNAPAIEPPRSAPATPNHCGVPRRPPASPATIAATRQL